MKDSDIVFVPDDQVVLIIFLYGFIMQFVIFISNNLHKCYHVFIGRFHFTVARS